MSDEQLDMRVEEEVLPPFDGRQRLGELTTDLWRCARNLLERSECLREADASPNTWSVFRAAERRQVEEVCDKYGYDPESALKALRSVTTEKWLWDNGVSSMLRNAI